MDCITVHGVAKSWTQLSDFHIPVHVKVKVTQSCPVLCDPMDWSMEFSRPEYWSGQPFPSLGDLPNPGVESRSPTLQVETISITDTIF